MDVCTYMDRPGRDKHDGVKRIALLWLGKQLFTKHDFPDNGNIFRFYPTWKVNYWPEEVKSQTIVLGTSQTIWRFLLRSSISLRKNNSAGVATPMCGWGWRKGMCGHLPLTLASGGWLMQPPWVFLSWTLHRLEYRAEILHSLWGVFCATFGEKIWSGQVRSRSYDVITGTTFGKISTKSWVNAT